MSKVIRALQSYLVFSLPLVIACMIWGTLQTEKEVLLNPTWLTRAAWEILSWNLMFWFVMLIVFLIGLVLLPEVREKTLKRLANLKERDEREQYITGKASRGSLHFNPQLVGLLSFLFYFFGQYLSRAKK